MALPSADVERVHLWCSAQVLVEQQDRVRVTCEVGPLHLTILQESPPWDGVGEWTSMPVARLRWTSRRAQWSLYCVDGNGRFRAYELATPAKTVVPLLAVVERDDTGIFWG